MKWSPNFSDTFGFRMFNFRQKLSILDYPEDIQSAKMQIDSGGFPCVSWLKSSSESTSLNFCRFDGSEWQFNDNDFKIESSINEFDFLIHGNSVYFSYDYLKEYGSDVYLNCVKYDLSEERFFAPVTLDSGNVQYCKSFVYSGNPYFLYIVDNYVFVKTPLGIVSLPQMSSLTIGGVLEKFSSSYGVRFFFLSWTEVTLSSIILKYCIFDFSSLTWGTIKTLKTFDKKAYSLSSCSNKLGDVAVPDSLYKPFYLALSRRESEKIKISLFEFNITDGYSDFATYNKHYRSDDFSSSPDVSVTVYGKKSFLSLTCEAQVLIKAEDLTYGYTKEFYPGGDPTQKLTSFIPLIDGNVFHYLYVTDNLYYGHDSLDYSPVRYSGKFVTSNSDDTFIFPSGDIKITDCDLLDIVKDSNFEDPFAFLAKNLDVSKIYFYDFNSGSYLNDFAITTTEIVDRCVFDKKYSRVLFSYKTPGIYSYNIVTKVSTKYLTFNLIDLKSPTDISYDDKEVFVSDPGNNRIVVLDRSGLSYLRTIKSSSMISPYRVVCGIDSTIYVKCYDATLIPIVYRFNRSGDILSSFPSYSDFPTSQFDYEPWYFSSGSYSSGKIAMTFKDSSQVLIIDDESGFWVTNNLTGYSLYGACVDDNTGHVFVSSLKDEVSGIVELDSLDGSIIHIYNAENYGMILLASKDGVGLHSQFGISNPSYSVKSSSTANYAGVNDESVVTALQKISNITEDTRDYSFSRLNNEYRHVTDRIVQADIYHFRFSGIFEDKVSIDPNLSFAYSGDGNLIRVPMFCWDFQESTFVDTFFVVNGSEMKKMALWYEKDKYYLQEIVSQTDINTVSSVFVSDGKVFVCAGGFLSIYSYESMNLLSSKYFVSDIKVHDYRREDGYIYAGSKSNGKIYKISSIDLENFNEIESSDAVVGMKWSDYFGKYIVHCENSLKFFDLSDNSVETFYDINGYTIKDISISNDKITISCQSYEKIPYAGDYLNNSDFVVAAENRRCDRVNVYVPNEKKYVFENNLDYDFISDSIVLDGDIVTLLGYDSSSVYVKIINSSSDNIFTYSFKTIEKPIEMIYMPVADTSFVLISDGSILDWSSGELKVIFEGETSATLASNGLLINRKEVTTQPSSSSSSSSSSGSGILEYRPIQVVVGDYYGGANKWDSGEFVIPKKCVLYGGGNNLEPGQRYYVSIRAKTDSGVWCDYATMPFVMPHFKNFVAIESSSSSCSLSSSNSLSSCSSSCSSSYSSSSCSCLSSSCSSSSSSYSSSSYSCSSSSCSSSSCSCSSSSCSCSSSSSSSSIPFIISGGVETIVSYGGHTYEVHTFNSSGTLSVAGSGNVEVLVVGGGGSAGQGALSLGGSGGGGGGGIVYDAAYAISDDISVVVGNGGTVPGGLADGDTGDNSQFGSLIGYGGIGGMFWRGYAPSQHGGASGAPQSMAGGGYTPPGPCGGGGGGAGQVGQNSIDWSSGSKGGDGLQYSIIGTPTYYGGGGGGGGVPNTGGLGGGGTANDDGTGDSGSANTGGGGGGGYAGGTSGSGGSGIVIVSLLLS